MSNQSPTDPKLKNLASMGLVFFVLMQSFFKIRFYGRGLNPLDNTGVVATFFEHPSRVGSATSHQGCAH